MITNNRAEIFELMCLALERKIISTTPDISKLGIEKCLEYDKLIEVKFNGKKYLVTFNYDMPLKVTNKKIERINRGCTLVKDLLDEIFNNYNILVVPNAEIHTDIQKAIASCKPQTGKDIELTYKVLDEADVLSDYKIQLGYSIEVKDTIEGTLDIQHFLSNCYVMFEDEKPVFKYDVEFSPQKEKQKLNLEEAKNIDKARYARLIKTVLNLFANDETKTNIMHEVFEKNDEINAYFTERAKLAKKYNIDKPRVDFNIIPVSISLNRVQTKNIEFTLQHKTFKNKNAKYVMKGFDPTELRNNNFVCPICGKPISEENALMILKDKDGNFVVGCKTCGQRATGEESYELYTPDALVVPEDGGDKTYFIKNCIQDDYDGKFYIGECVNYDVFIGKIANSKPSKQCVKSHTRNCPNCGKVIAGNFEEALLKDVNSEKVVCCNYCLDESVEGGYIKSEISKPARVFKDSPARTVVDEINGTIGEKHQFTVCPHCGTHVVKKSRKSSRICNHCEQALGKIVLKDVQPAKELPSEIQNYISSHYGCKNFAKCVVSKDIFGNTEYRILDYRKMYFVKTNEYNEIIFVKESKNK